MAAADATNSQKSAITLTTSRQKTAAAYSPFQCIMSSVDYEKCLTRLGKGESFDIKLKSGAFPARLEGCQLYAGGVPVYNCQDVLPASTRVMWSRFFGMQASGGAPLELEKHSIFPNKVSGIGAVSYSHVNGSFVELT